MKKLLSAIARALRSTTAFVWERCHATGAWTLKAMASIGAGGGGGDDEEIVETAAIDPGYGAAADVIAKDDGSVDRLLKQSKALLASIADEFAPADGYERIRSIARDLTDNVVCNPDYVFKLSMLQADWLDTMTPEMIELVANAPREDLIAHMRGGKGITGVIRCDKESIKDWKRSDEMERARASYEVEVPMDGEPNWAQGRLAAC